MSAGEQEAVVLHTGAGDRAVISLHGAQLLSWHPAGAEEQIYRSPLSVPSTGKSVRGGTPICFPQFSDRGPLPKHGFVRTSHWELGEAPMPDREIAEAHFQIDSAMLPAAWDHPFCLVLVARLGRGWLELNLQAANTGRTPYSFTAALHTYFAVHDVRTVSVSGLAGLQYEDALQANALERDDAPALMFPGEVDRVYRDVPRELHLRGGGMPERRVIQQGFADAVLWNPGADKAARLGDMPPQDWLRMVCIEAAAVAHPVTLAPGKTWRGMQRLELASLSP
jgi:glucose-6-phosphate 1-epimerase